MPTDLYSRVVANAYRIVGASSGDDHLTIRKAAERACARARIGAPTRVADELPAVPPSLLTEPHIHAALGRLLVPRSRLEERLFALPAPHDESALGRTRRAALHAIADETNWDAGHCWRRLLADMTLWEALAADDRALPRITAADVAALRDDAVALVLAAAVAAVRGAVTGRHYREVERFRGFVKDAAWPDAPKKRALADILDAIATQAATICSGFALPERAEQLTTISRDLGPLWRLINSTPNGYLADEVREMTAKQVLPVLVEALHDERADAQAVTEAWGAAGALFTGSKLRGEYRALENQVNARRTPRTVPHDVPPAVQTIVGDVCPVHGGAPFEDGACLWCRTGWLEEPERIGLGIAVARYLQARLDGPLGSLLVIAGYLMFMAVPSLFFFAFAAWLTWQVIREARGYLARNLTVTQGALVVVVSVFAVLGFSADHPQVLDTAPDHPFRGRRVFTHDDVEHPDHRALRAQALAEAQEKAAAQARVSVRRVTVIAPVDPEDDLDDEAPDEDAAEREEYSTGEDETDDTGEYVADDDPEDYAEASGDHEEGEW